MRVPAALIAAPALCLVALACRSSQQPRTVDLRSEAGSCRAEVEGADLTAWKEIRGSGFTYCVPADWEAVGRIAHRGHARVEWNVGVPARDLVAPELGSGEVRTVQRGGLGVHPRNPTESVRFSEPIDGRPAELYREALGGGMPPRSAYLTGAQWFGPAVHFSGQAAEIASAELQFLIYRTTRFDPAGNGRSGGDPR